jgi:hypothetical protein
MREVRAVNDRTNNYDALLARESESRERIQKALFELDMQKTRDAYSPTALRRILEGEK